MSEVIEQESTELVTLPAKETALSVYSTAGGLEPYLQRIKAEIDAFVPDTSTAKGRAAIASMAFKVAKIKTAIEGLGKTVSAELKEIPKKVDAERKRTREKLELWQAEVRQPLTDWEEAEGQRVANHRHELAMLEGFSECGDLDAKMIRANIEDIEGLSIDESWEEFEAEAHRVKGKTLAAMRSALAAREKHEAEQAELAKLRAEAAERERKDREAAIAREAEERVRKEAEDKAQAERDAAAKREADAKAAAERRELELKLQAETAERERLEAVQRAEKEKADASARAEKEKQDAEERQRQAVEAERKRQADEAAQIEAEAKKREADREHKGKVLRKAKEAIMTAGITEDQARAVIKLISAGKVPRVGIEY